MGRRSRQTSRMVAAIFAAYVLMLQGLLGAMASGQHAAGMVVDRAIHLSSCDPAGGGAVPPNPADHAKLPPCCMQGCSLNVAIGDLPPAIATLVAYERVSLVAAATDALRRDASSFSRTEARPRAPPASLLTI